MPNDTFCVVNAVTGSRRRLYVWVGLVLLLLLGFVALLQVNKSTSDKHVVLGDGRELSLRAVTRGTNSTFVAGSLFQRTVGRRLPSKLKARFRVREMQVRPEPPFRGTDLLVVWLEVKPGAQNVIARIADDSGHEHPASRANASGGPLPSGAWISAHEFCSFPRRSRFLTIRVYSLSGAPSMMLAEFRVRNPAYDKYPEWQPEPLPITRETNGLRFTITHFNTGLYATGHLANTSSNWTEIVYDYDAGPWRPVAITVTDATGNRIHKRTPMQRMMAAPRPLGTLSSFDHARRGMVSLPAVLWLDEPAWKVQLELERVQRSSFASNTWWEVKDVAVPAPGQTNYVNVSPSDYGTNIIFKSLIVARGRPQIDLQRPRDDRPLVTLLTVTDDRGTNVFFTHAPPPNPDAYVLNSSATNARTLNFRFALHHRITLEFVARPRLLHRSITKDDEW